MRVLTSLATRGAILGDIIDSMSSQVVVLDSEGRVILVNQAFLDFGRDNGHPEPEALVGTNYLKVCVAGARTGATEAGSVGMGIQRVLMGQTSLFTTIYDCHSPMERRWFRVKVTRWKDGKLHGAVVVHDDITSLFLAERALLRASGRGAPMEHVVTFCDLAPALQSLADCLSHLAAKQVIVDVDSGMHVMNDVEAIITVVARLALDASRDGPIRIEGIRQGRRIIIRIGGWRREIDVNLIDAQLDTIQGRAVVELGGARNAPLIDIVMGRARPPHQRV